VNASRDFVLVSVRDHCLDGADLAEALKEPFGDRAQFVGGARQHRIRGATIAQRAQNLAMQSQNFRQDLLVGLIDVAMDQILKAACLAFQLDQKLVGLTHLAHVVPGPAQNVGAVPDQRGEDHGDGRIERRNRQQAPPDRQHPDEALGFQVKASPRPRISRCGLFILEGDQIKSH
jgi:hypothetical protein